VRWGLSERVAVGVLLYKLHVSHEIDVKKPFALFFVLIHVTM
jgi:hypothetical protein